MESRRMKEIKRQTEFADGTILKADAGENGDDLWIWMQDEHDKNNSFVRLARLLSDPEKTAKITYTIGDDVQEFEGFTLLDTLKMDGGKISARLKKER